MSVKFSNNGHSTLAASLASNATSITVASGHGARFPSLSSGEYFYATLIDASNNLEIVKCTARSSDVLTVTRAQEGTTARAFAIGDRIELRVTAQGLVDATNIDNIVPDQSSHSGKFLTTDGTNVSFATAITGAADFPSTSVLQVKSATFSGTQTGAFGSFTDVTNLSVTITPTSSSSKFLLLGGLHCTVYTLTAQFRFLRDSTAVGVGNSSNSRTRTTSGFLHPSTDGNHQSPKMTGIHLDSPSTSSAITYKIQVKTQSNNTGYINRSQNDVNNGDWSHRAISSLAVLEVQG